MSVFLIPLTNQSPQSIRVTLGGVSYILSSKYRGASRIRANSAVVGAPSLGWVMDIADANANPLVMGISLVTGADLLAQYAYRGFGGGLWVQNSLYRIGEAIAEDCKGLDNVVALGWTTRNRYKIFTHSTNSVAAFGDDARHGSESTEPPPKPMSINEVQNFMEGLLSNWISFIAQREK